jgi:hypothetical protein
VWEPGDDPRAKWRWEYGHYFHVSVNDMGELFPEQVAHMDNALEQIRARQQQGR